MPKLNYWETVIRVLPNGSYSTKNKERLYLDVQKFCRENPELVPAFKFRKRGGVLTSPDVDLALRNLMDGGIIVTEECSGLIKIIE